MKNNLEKWYFFQLIAENDDLEAIYQGNNRHIENFQNLSAVSTIHIMK